MKLMKLLFLLPLFFLLVLTSACEQPEDDPSPGPGGGGFHRCIQVESTQEIPADCYYTYQYCDGCCWRGGEWYNQFPLPTTSTKFFKPGSFCYHNLQSPNLPNGQACTPQTDDPGCTNCSGGGGTHAVNQTQKSALLSKYPDLGWAIDQGFLLPESQ